VDAFEIQVYASDTAPRGEAGLEIHANHHFVDDSHLTFEPHYGLTDWIELGGYLQTALVDDDPAFGGVKLRVKVRLPDKLWHDRIGLAVNTEVSWVPAQFEPDQWGSEIRPIADFSSGRWYASINPILAIDLAGDIAGIPQLEPAAKLSLRPAPRFAIGFEAYTEFGPLDALGSEKAATLLAALDYAGRHIDLNVGVGPSWGTSDVAIIKLILGFHP
jgi:hypothetical protein